MQTQSYLQLDPQQINTLRRSDREADEARAAARRAQLENAGFVDRAQFEEQTASNERRLWLAQQFYPELTGRTLTFWRRFLPTTSKPSEYTYDAVPAEALEAISTANGLNLFDRIDVCTPEGNSFFSLVGRNLDLARKTLAELTNSVDPMAVGVIKGPNGNEHFFQIARWGEALQPFSAIKRHVRRVYWTATLLFVVLPVVLVLGGLAGMYRAIEVHGFWTAMGYSFGVIVTTAVTIFFAALFTAASITVTGRIRRRRRLARRVQAR